MQQSATLTASNRAELDRRLGPVLGRLGVRGTANAARRIAAGLDAAAVVRRMEAAVRSRRVTVRPAPDGMACLTVLGPMPEVHLVMTDRALMGTGDLAWSVFEPARFPGHGSVPAPVARAWLRQGLDAPRAENEGVGVGRARLRQELDVPSAGHAAVGAARVWVRRLYTSPDGRDLVAMESRRRLFRGLLRRMLVLRDDVCRTPWCEAPIAHADHGCRPARWSHVLLGRRRQVCSLQPGKGGAGLVQPGARLQWGAGLRAGRHHSE